MTFIQYMSMIFSVMTFIIIIYWRLKDKSVSLYLVPAISWLAHVIIYYSARIIDLLGKYDFHQYDKFLFSDWSAYLRFHGIFTVFYFVVIESDVTFDILKGVKILWKKLVQ